MRGNTRNSTTAASPRPPRQQQLTTRTEANQVPQPLQSETLLTASVKGGIRDRSRVHPSFSDKQTFPGRSSASEKCLFRTSAKGGGDFSPRSERFRPAEGSIQGIATNTTPVSSGSRCIGRRSFHFLCGWVSATRKACVTGVFGVVSHCCMTLWRLSGILVTSMTRMPYLAAR